MKKTLAASLTLAVALTGAACTSTDTADDNSATTATQGKEERVDAMPWLREQFGADPSEVLMQDPSTWYGYVNGAYVDHGNLHVQLQVDRKADKDLGERAAKALANFVSFSDDPVVSDVSWAIAEDGAGTIIKQEKVSR